MAYDVDAICNSRDFILVCTATPIEVAIGMAFLYILLGPSAFVAFAGMLLSFPLAALPSRHMSGLQLQVRKKTDSRVSVITEVLSSIRTIKYLGWEDVMSKIINKHRSEEEALTWRRNFAEVAVVVIGDLIPLLTLFCLFATSILLKQPITAARAFMTGSVIETLRLQFVWVANVTRFFSQARVSFGRINRYMVNEPETVAHPEGLPAFRNAGFRRSLDEDSFRLELDVEFVVDGLNVVAGASGSGKSRPLLSLLGETVHLSGDITCPRDVAYASQIPWILNDTIRANIILHEPFDEDRYGRILDACALIQDLEGMAQFDMTEVETNGANLSGGQKQRLCLTRAIYTHSGTLLLDDVFSALDATIQTHIWDRCCCHGDLIRGRTFILVTQMETAKTEADLVVERSDGCIQSSVSRQGLKRLFPAPQAKVAVPNIPK